MTTTHAETVPIREAEIDAILASAPRRDAVRVRETLAKAKELMGSKELEEKRIRNNILRRLSEAKIMAPEVERMQDANDKAKEAWEKTDKKQAFIPLHSKETLERYSVADITPVPPGKFTDQSMKAMAEYFAFEAVKSDYDQLTSAIEIMTTIKDNIINIGKRIDSVNMAFGIEHKMTGGYSE